jgi:hypothetical protein
LPATPASDFLASALRRVPERADLLEAASRAQRPLRVHKSESGVEIEPVRIIDSLWPDVASEIAKPLVVADQAQKPGRLLPGTYSQLR